MNLNRFFIKFFAKKVGEDEFNNQYYQKENRRYVLYKGIAEPSKVPTHWSSWLHYISDEIPTTPKKYSWQKTHTPNLTGTKFAYNPAKNKDYQKKIFKSWTPS